LSFVVQKIELKILVKHTILTVFNNSIIRTIEEDYQSKTLCRLIEVIY